MGIRLHTPRDPRLRYLACGALVFIAHLALAAAVFSLPSVARTALGRNAANLAVTEASFLLAFLLHDRITWNHAKTAAWPARLIRFHVVSMFGLVARVAVFAGLDACGMHWLVSTLASIAVAVVCNWFGYSRLVFTKHEDTSHNDAA